MYLVLAVADLVLLFIYTQRTDVPTAHWFITGGFFLFFSCSAYELIKKRSEK